MCDIGLYQFTLTDLKIEPIPEPDPIKREISQGIRLTHIPTGIVVEVNESRVSTNRNLNIAFKRLHAKLEAQCVG